MQPVPSWGLSATISIDVLGIFQSLEKGSKGKGKRTLCVSRAQTSAGFTGLLPPDDEQPLSFHNNSQPAPAKHHICVIKRLFRQ